MQGLYTMMPVIIGTGGGDEIRWWCNTKMAYGDDGCTMVVGGGWSRGSSSSQELGEKKCGGAWRLGKKMRKKEEKKEEGRTK